MRLEEGTWVEFDSAEPALSAKNSDTAPPAVDVEIGPNNAYPQHGRIWPTDTPATCSEQAGANDNAGFQQEVALHKLLEAREGSTVHLCIVTGSGRTGSLSISSVQHDKYAPYQVGYSFTQH